MHVLELEHGSVIHGPENGTQFLTHLTMTLSTIGLALSGFALTLLIATACLFPAWRKSFKNQLLIQFMLCRFFYTFVRYFYDVMVVFQFCIRADCIIYLDNIFMTYTEAALIAWMFIFTRYMYSSLVTVFNVNPSVWKVSIFTWVVPFIVAGISHMIYKYQNDYDKLFFFIYMAAVKWPVLLSNAVLLIIILTTITKKNESKVQDNSKSNVRLVIIMNILLWTFCFQQVFLDIFTILYIILNVKPNLLIAGNIMLMYQCAFSILFWVFGNAEARRLWRTTKFYAWLDSRHCHKHQHQSLTHL